MTAAVTCVQQSEDLNKIDFTGCLLGNISWNHCMLAKRPSLTAALYLPTKWQKMSWCHVDNVKTTFQLHRCGKRSELKAKISWVFGRARGESDLKMVHQFWNASAG